MTRIDRRSALFAATAVGGALLATSRASGQPDTARHSAVEFWSDLALELNALDHTLGAENARAIGPCASAWALGLTHLVMADACAHGDPTAGYKPYFDKAMPPAGRPASADHFIAGAAAANLLQIFPTPAHAFLIGTRRAEFFRRWGSDPDSWNAGVTFARQSEIARQWDWRAIALRILPAFSAYVPRPGQHDADPFNPMQGFYGSRWGEAAARISANADVRLPPPPANYAADLEEVRERGKHRLLDEAPSEDTQIGLFWAYDGARLLGTPPRLYNLIARQLLPSGTSPAQKARFLALINVAMADAGIVAWRAKYEFAVWRPVRGVQATMPGWVPYGAPKTNQPRLMAPGGPLPDMPPIPLQRLLGQAFVREAVADASAFAALLDETPSAAQSLLGADRALARGATGAASPGGSAFTPNFPAYPSGHATFGAACFRAAQRFMGGSEEFPEITVVSEELDGIAVDHATERARPRLSRSFNTYKRLIEENNDSRVTLGVHWRFDSTEGAKAGERIGDNTFEALYRPV